MQDISQSEVVAWKAQLKKGTLELAVLAQLKKKRRYGLELVEVLNDFGLEISEGSIYPLLSRLRNEGKIVSEWVDEGSGHAHKYYKLTPQGSRCLQGMVGAWRGFSAAFGRITEGLYE